MSVSETLELLGGRRNVIDGRGMDAETVMDEPLRFRVDAAKHLAAVLATPLDRVLTILGIEDRTARRRKEQGELSFDESDRLYRMARIMRYAEKAFDSAANAHGWLQEDNVNFGGRAPLDLLGTELGARRVEDELTRIDYGDFA